ncbi:MAG TPA: universal stress protein [Patescibacteria group bacterium]|nr:universal stress protein [Patescibacteria group bacterium]
MFTPKKILVPTDFSAPAAIALEYAKDIARMHGSEIFVIHSVEPAVYPGDIREMQTDLVTNREYMFELSDSQLKKIIEPLLAAGMKANLRTVYGGNPADEIVSFSEANDIDLICIATHGRSGWQHLMLGSIAERVLRKAKCPVLTVKRKGDEK